MDGEEDDDVDILLLVAAVVTVAVPPVVFWFVVRFFTSALALIHSTIRLLMSLSSACSFSWIKSL